MQCAWINCDRPTRSRGLCARHYDWTLRAGLRVARRSKACTEPDCTDAPYKQQTVCRAHYERQLRARRKTNGVKRKSRANPNRVTNADRLDELAGILQGGEYPPRAVARLGWTAAGAEKAARKYDRPEIREYLYRYVAAEKSTAA